MTRILTNERKICADQTNEKRQAVTAISSSIHKLGEDRSRSSMRGQMNQRDQNRKESNNMNDKNGGFDFWQ